MNHRWTILTVSLFFASFISPPTALAEDCENAGFAAPECGPQILRHAPSGGGQLLPSWQNVTALVPGGGDLGFSPPVCSVGMAGCGNFAGGSCAWYQMYEIDAEVKTGEGSATARVRCGDSAVECTVSTSGPLACHDEFAEGPGEFFCGIVNQTGTIDVVGSCKDPANPHAVYRFATGSSIPARS